jgi:hypothetical protein
MKNQGPFFLIMHGKGDYVSAFECYISKQNVLSFKREGEPSEDFEDQVNLGRDLADTLNTFLALPLEIIKNPPLEPKGSFHD